MSAITESILAKLKVKPIPVTQTVVPIKYAKQKEEVQLATAIVDKRPTVKINRTEILSKIGHKPTVKSEIIAAESIAEEKKLVIDKKTEKQIEEDDEEAALLAALAEEDGEEAALLAALDDEVLAKEDDEEAALLAALEDITVKDTKPKAISIGKSKTPAKTKKAIEIKPHHTVLSVAPEGVEKLNKRLAKKEPSIIYKASAYYLNNREIFINFINRLLHPYKEELEKIKDSYNCDSKAGKEFSLLTHQKIVRDYINLLTPYRGLLLYHGLGSGKTCSSVAIAEGLKSDRQVIIMLPASLEVNYKEELKKCGDKLYKKNQYWEFISATTSPQLVDSLAYILSLSPEFIKKNGGAWFVNVNEPPNYSNLLADQQLSLDIQLNKMIDNKYKFIRYNGLRQKRLDKLVEEAGGNPFSNKVIIIDEAHNLISRIVNKLKRPTSLAMQLYQYLKSAENTRIVLLTGTPIINYPNEIGIMMNILRGNIRTWTFQLENKGGYKLTEDSLLILFKSHPMTKNILDYLQYKATPEPSLSITRNPYGFYSNYSEAGEYKGVSLGENGNIDDDMFIRLVTEILSEKGIRIIPTSISVKEYTCLPDSKEDFIGRFIEPAQGKKPATVKNMDLFKRRILGLVSYFPDIDALLPTYSKYENFKIIMIDMSDFQFSVYEEARVAERKIEENNAKKRAKQPHGDGTGDMYEDTVSTYRIFSRAFCNFVFPRPDIHRPLPRDGTQIATAINETADEDVLDAIPVEEKIATETGATENLTELAQEEDLIEQASPEAIKENISYALRIATALKQLDDNKDKYLSPEGLEIYSPKFLNILSRVLDLQYIGLHLIYSQFRTLEGIGILALVLKANGFAQFKIAKVGKEWKLNIQPEDMLKPKYIFYTGTENAEEKEILRNIFNSNLDLVPTSLREELVLKFPEVTDNMYGDIIKVIMITASGAEGISLSNVRYVHLTEPYWHPVRIDQVIGRARRICSHKNLPKEYQTVEVFLYLMKFSEIQLKSDLAREAKIHDRSKIESDKVITSDESLYEIATQKETINHGILHNIKEASVDCSIHKKLGSKDQLKCFSFGSVNPYKFAYAPSISTGNSDKDVTINQVIVKYKMKNVKLGDRKFAVNMANISKENEDENGIIEAEIFPLDSVANHNPVQIGILYFKNLKPDRYVFL